MMTLTMLPHVSDHSVCTLQVRYVHYLEAILYHNINASAEPPMLLNAVQLHKCPGPVFLSIMIFSKGTLMYDSRQVGVKLPQIKEGSNHVFNFPTLLITADVKVEIYRHEKSSPNSARIGSQKYDSNQEKWPWCQVVFHTLFHYNETELRYDKMSVDYCHKDRKHEKFAEDFQMALHFVRPEDIGGFALTANHTGSLMRSAFPSLDPEIVYGGLRILVRSADHLKMTPCDGVFVRFEIEGLEIDGDFTHKLADGNAHWNQIVDVVVSRLGLPACTCFMM